ncbi:MAG TPA: HAD family hydrolase [Candidatus Binataceae bacterium]|nr:HAD family hydrolase [Candidatus Binataceae bacterium]
MSANSRRHLIFDADDTLWDSNIHFLEAFAEFAAAAARSNPAIGETTAADAVRRAELELIETHGYGRRPYVLALHRAADGLAANGGAPALHAAVDRIGERLCARDCPLLPDVAETVAALSERHRLVLFTKGQRDEQMEKLARSGLQRHFSRVETPREKDVEAYRRLIREAELPPERAWMIGNSPRSDINPSVRAGLRAVYIPHPHTWELEHEELDRDERIVRINSFRGLLDLF